MEENNGLGEIIDKTLSRVDKADLALSAIPFSKLKSIVNSKNPAINVLIDQTGNILGASFDSKDGEFTHVFGGGKKVDEFIYDLLGGSLGGAGTSMGIPKNYSDFLKGLGPMGKTLMKDEKFRDRFFESVGWGKGNPWATKYGLSTGKPEKNSKQEKPAENNRKPQGENQY